jgi:hypothetical protein
LPAGQFALKGADAQFALGWPHVGGGVNRLLIPNAHFPVDLLLFRVLQNTEIKGLVESTYSDVRAPDANDDLNFGLAFTALSRRSGKVSTW